MRLTGRGTPQDVTFEANADLSALQWTFVKPVSGSATGPQARVDSATSGEAGCYILQNKPTQYKGAVVRVGPFSTLKVDGSGTPIAVGDYLKPSTGGVGIKITAGDAYSARALEASSAAGDYIEVACERGLSHA